VHPLQEDRLLHTGHHVEPVAAGRIETEADRGIGPTEVSKPHYAEGDVLVRDWAIGDSRPRFDDPLDLLVVEEDAVS
jgi:hypothetical protein